VDLTRKLDQLAFSPLSLYLLDKFRRLRRLARSIQSLKNDEGTPCHPSRRSSRRELTVDASGTDLQFGNFDLDCRVEKVVDRGSS
jgi:hypothetical protein